MADAYPWEDHIQRQILVCAIAGDLYKTPDVLQPAFFGDDGPRHLIARAFAAHVAVAPGERPGFAAMDVLVEQMAGTLAAVPADAVRAEWRLVHAMHVDNPTWIMATVREWAKQREAERVLFAAVDILKRARDTNSALNLDEWNALMARPAALVRDEVSLLKALVDRSDLDAARRFYAGGHQRRRVPTGFAELDAATGGGPPIGQTYYALAPPKGGKTAFLLNVALGGARRGAGCVLASFEMSGEDMFDRAYRSITGETRSALHATPHRALRAAKGWVVSGAAPVWFYALTPGQSVSDVVDVVRDLRSAGHDIALVIFDYLNTMTSAHREREKRHELTRISREMVRFAKQQQVVVWSAALVNRQAVDKRIVTKTDIAEAFEVIAVLDGAVALCADARMREVKVRAMFLSAMRHEGDDRVVGIYSVDFATMRIRPASPDVIAALRDAQKPTLKPVAHTVA